MRTDKIFRLILLPFGLIFRLYDLAVNGSRDLHNKLRFKEAIVDKGCCIDLRTNIREHVHILCNSIILNSTIGRFSYIGRNSTIQNTTIGPFCSVASDVLIGLGTHPGNLFSTSPVFYRVNNIFKVRLIDKDHDFEEYRLIEIGHDVWIGARAIVLDGVRIGDGAVIAANAVVTKDVPPYAVVAGVPARIVKERLSRGGVAFLQKSRWWTWSLDEIHKRMHELNEQVTSLDVSTNE